MSDIQALDQRIRAGNFASDEAQRRIRRRYGADRRLQAYGIIAISLAIGFLGVLLTSIVMSGLPAFVQTNVNLAVYVDPAKLDPKDPQKGNFRTIVRDAVAPFVPAAATDKDRADVAKILTSDAPYIVRDYVKAHPETIGQRITLAIPMSAPSTSSIRV